MAVLYRGRGGQGVNPFNPLTVAILAAASVYAGGTGVASGAVIDLGVADSLATDQPRVTVAVSQPSEDLSNETFLGPNVYDQFILDTGANGLLFAAAAYVDSAPYEPAKRPSDNSDVHYTESGIGGSVELDVFRNYRMYYAGTDGVPLVLDDHTGAQQPGEGPGVHMFGSETNADLGDIPGLIGMPAMDGHVVHWDLKQITITGGLDFMGTYFPTSVPTPPTGTPYTYHVALSRLPFEHTGVQQPGDPVPLFADLPLIDVQNGVRGHRESGTMLLDSGAQLSMISSDFAAKLGLNLDFNDPNNDIVDLDGDGDTDADDLFPVNGLAGEELIFFTHIDELVIPTREGTDLVLHDLEVGVLDVPGLELAGILGMNVFTSGYGDLLFDALLGDLDPGTYGTFGDAFLDFTNAEDWNMRLDVNPAFVTAVPEPAFLLPLALGGLLLRRRRRQ